MRPLDLPQGLASGANFPSSASKSFNNGFNCSRMFSKYESGFQTCLKVVSQGHAPGESTCLVLFGPLLCILFQGPISPEPSPLLIDTGPISTIPILKKYYGPSGQAWSLKVG